MSMRTWIIEDICEKFENWEGNDVIVADLPNYLYQSALADGSILYSTYETRQWIAKYFEDIAEVIEDREYEIEDCVDLKQAFTNPEAFHVDLCYFLCNSLLHESEWVSNNEDEEVELTEEIIETIKGELLATI